jgi:uridine phosphorylase
VLDGAIGLGHVVVPATAVRDEGTSYHYLPPSREVAASPAAVQAIEQALQKHHVPYVVGKTWTTDAIYRETPTRIARRRAEGCHVVEMEAAAFFAVAQFRGVRFGQLLYGGDDLTGDSWDGRNWQKESGTRARLFQLAVEACLLL